MTNGYNKLCKRFHLCLILACSGITIVRSGDLIRPRTASFNPGHETAPAIRFEDDAFSFPLHFTAATDRLFWDIPIRAPGRTVSAIALDYHCEDPDAIHSITLHLQDRGHWLSASIHSIERGRGTLIFDRRSFQVESGSPEWHHAQTLRISFWKHAEQSTSFRLRSIREHSPSIVIVCGNQTSAPGESAIATAFSARAMRLFASAGQPATLIDDDDLDKLAYTGIRWVVLPYNPRLSRRQRTWLEIFSNEHQGRIAVFYNADATLARTMNVIPLPYRSQSPPWPGVQMDGGRIDHLPEFLAHRTSHLLPVRAADQSGITTGHWLQRNGRPAPDLPAAVQNAKGFWFSHIPPLASPAAAQWLLAHLAAADPRYQPELNRFIADSEARDQEARRLAAALAQPGPELRGVWSKGIDPKRRAWMMQNLAATKINAVFEHVASAGFIREQAGHAPGASAAGSPLAQDYLAHIQTLAEEYNIEFHAWVILLFAEDLDSATRTRLRDEGRLMMDLHGNTLPWLCPSHPENRAMLVKMIRTLAGSGISGIHLDYARYPERQACFSAATRLAFEKKLGQSRIHWPDDVKPGGSLAEEYDKFRRDEITSLVQESLAVARRTAPGIKLSAAVYPGAESAAANGQDWPRWLQLGLLDFVCPMIYTRSMSQFDKSLVAALEHTGTPAKIVPGIGVSSDHSQLDALATLQQCSLARQKKTGGHIFFQLDIELINRVLPLLQADVRTEPHTKSPKGSLVPAP